MDELPLPAPAPRPRVWSALTVAFLALVASLIVAGFVQVGALFATGAFHPGVKSGDLLAATLQLVAKPWGPAMLILPGQLTMLAAALGAALLSPHRLAPRLGYTRSVLPWKTLPLLLGGTFFAAQIGGLVVQSIFENPGATLQLIADMMQQATGFRLAILVVLLCILPPIAEEALFRGYLQRRLLQRWPPAAAVAVSSLFFVTAHFDPIHVLAIVPLAIWLGVVAWRCDSIWPSMVCHAAQNTAAMWLTRQGEAWKTQITTGDIVVMVISAAFTVGAIVVMRRYPVPGRAEKVVSASSAIVSQETPEP